MGTHLLLTVELEGSVASDSTELGSSQTYEDISYVFDGSSVGDGASLDTITFPAEAETMSAPEDEDEGDGNGCC